MKLHILGILTLLSLLILSCGQPKPVEENLQIPDLIFEGDTLYIDSHGKVINQEVRID